MTDNSRLRVEVPEEIDAGAPFTLVVSVAGDAGDLAGTPFAITDADREVHAGEWPAPSDGDQHTAEIPLTAPPHVAEFTWTLRVPGRDVDGAHHDEASLHFSFRTRPHPTSLAVWDNPSPVVAGNPFSVKVGAKCAVGCALAGKGIDICDENGGVIASAALGDRPWPGTTGLYWAAVDIRAPTRDDHFQWSLKFSSAEVRLPHAGASASFSFVTSGPPEHSVSVEVVEKGTAKPVHEAYVRLGVYRSATDETGIASFDVPAGEHCLSIWKAGYDAPDDAAVRVTTDQQLRIELIPQPEEDPYAYWKG
jgi:hypothetical protein